MTSHLLNIHFYYILLFRDLYRASTERNVARERVALHSYTVLYIDRPIYIALLMV